MDKDDKDFRDAVEKVINEREERKKEYVVDEHTGYFPKPTEKKKFKEAVEKVIDEREERKRASMGKSPDLIEKKHLAKDAPSPVKKSKMKRVDLILAVIFIAGLLIWFGWPTIMPGEEATEPVTVYPANVVLYSFNESLVLHFTKLGDEPIEFRTSDYVSVSFGLKNTGDEDATDVSCFVKCCDQDGTILFAQMFTFGDIAPDSSSGSMFPGGSYSVSLPAMGWYKVPISNETVYVTHSIDIRWSPHGTNTYTKLTET